MSLPHYWVEKQQVTEQHTMIYPFMRNCSYDEAFVCVTQQDAAEDRPQCYPSVEGTGGILIFIFMLSCVA